MESFKQNYLRKMELIKNALTENIQAAKAWQMELSEFVDLTDAIQSLEKIKDNFEVKVGLNWWLSGNSVPVNLPLLMH